MKKLIILILLVNISAICLGQKLSRPDENQSKGIVFIEDYNIGNIIEPPVVTIPFLPVKSIRIDQKQEFSNEVLATVKANEILFPDEYAALELNTDAKTISFIKPNYTLDIKAYQAIDRAPAWLSADLHRQFRKLRKYALDDDFAQLILNAPEKVVDEVAFQIANLSTETLRDTRFRATLNLLTDNALFLYKCADSLQYVKIVEHGSFSSRDYYTTTKYRIKSGNDTIWYEIPRDIYYWYVVMPKLDREGVYEQDLTSSTQFRTYGYFWRQYLWNNPVKTFDYTKVNITTPKGSIDTIQRFGDLIKMPKVLWDRNQTYFPFKRSFDPTDHALDVIGNWASRAIPIDAKDNRPFEPNQIIFEHDGNCHEDALLIVAACRTALIPIIHLNTNGEDHAFGSVYDNDKWYHFEFFRGGFSEVINPSFAGITNLMKGGSYSWTTSVVQGTRSDGYRINHTAEYSTKLCNLEFTVVDKNGKAVDGAKIILWCSPGPYSSGWVSKIGWIWTDHTGTAKITVGAGKKYAFQVYHPKFGYLPDQSNAYVINQTNAVSGQTYQASAVYSDKQMPELTYGNLQKLPPDANYGVHVNFTSKNIVAGIYDEDVQKSQFAFRNDSDGNITFFLLNEANYLKFQNKEAFDYYFPVKYFNSGNLYLTLPAAGKWYVIFSNQEATVNYQQLELTGELLNNAVYQSIDFQPDNNACIAFPNPFSDKCRFIRSPWVKTIEIFDVFGKKIQVLEDGTNYWIPGKEVSSGTYLVKFSGDDNMEIQKIQYFRN
ncbi:MAG TPA: T9SS type A sorting domain-containing protein [Bacteroidia bacterium]|nr:T9SS type A sorting domain-containing protein [Bacteroidia bacterium]HRS59910.1 T9SS type A sorting domain-containing protein [Bacteroidia bacterium]HRU68678.1 T9SS type A sorting domain-containing protein [Bacteroidia bacterium]